MQPMSYQACADAVKAGHPLTQDIGDGKYIIMTVQPDFMRSVQALRTTAVDIILNAPAAIFDEQRFDRQNRIVAMMVLVKNAHLQAQQILAVLGRDMPIASTMEMTNTLLRRGLLPYHSSEQRVRSMPYLKQLSETYFGYFSEEDRILEIGSSCTDAEGNSFLMNLLPEKIRRLITPSDINPQENERSPKRNVVLLDACMLAEHFPAKSFSKVVSCSVLDQLTEERLLATLAGVEKTLTDGGMLIEMSDLPIFPTTISHHYCNKDLVCFPLLDDLENDGLQVIDRQSFIRFVNENRTLLPIEKEFLLWYAQELPLYIDTMLCNWFERKIDLTAAKFISKWISEMQIQEMKTIRRKEFFKTMVTEALRKTGFECVQYKTVASVTRQGGQVMRHATLRVLIAKKRAPSTTM